MATFSENGWTFRATEGDRLDRGLCQVYATLVWRASVGRDLLRISKHFGMSGTVWYPWRV